MVAGLWEGGNRPRNRRRIDRPRVGDSRGFHSLPGLGAVDSAHYFAADDDVGDLARVHGIVVLSFACFSAATPRLEDLARRVTLPEIAPRDFIAQLPKRLLAHPQGGVLAMIGHVGKATGFSFSWGPLEKQIDVFVDVFDRLLSGQRVGHATEAFDLRFTEISSMLLDIQDDPTTSDEDLVAWWIARNDARNYLRGLALGPLASAAFNAGGAT